MNSEKEKYRKAKIYPTKIINAKICMHMFVALSRRNYGMDFAETSQIRITHSLLFISIFPREGELCG